MATWPTNGEDPWGNELKDYVDTNGFVSTDSSLGLSAPTGEGAEFVIVADVLDEIRYNGTTVWTA